MSSDPFNLNANEKPPDLSQPPEKRNNPGVNCEVPPEEEEDE